MSILGFNINDSNVKSSWFPKIVENGIPDTFTTLSAFAQYSKLRIKKYNINKNYIIFDSKERNQPVALLLILLPVIWSPENTTKFKISFLKKEEIATSDSLSCFNNRIKWVNIMK